MRYLRIPADIVEPIVEVNDDTDPASIPATLTAMQKEVGGYVERVAVGHAAAGRALYHAAMLVNEEGLIKNLPINPRASILYGGQIHGNRIHGDAVIIGEEFNPMEGMEWTNLREPVTVEALERLLDGEVIEEILA